MTPSYLFSKSCRRTFKVTKFYAQKYVWLLAFDILFLTIWHLETLLFTWDSLRFTILMLSPMQWKRTPSNLCHLFHVSDKMIKLQPNYLHRERTITFCWFHALAFRHITFCIRILIHPHLVHVSHRRIIWWHVWHLARSSSMRLLRFCIVRKWWLKYQENFSSGIGSDIQICTYT